MSNPLGKPPSSFSATLQNYVAYLRHAYESKAWGTLGFNLLVASLACYGVFSVFRVLTHHFQGEQPPLTATSEPEVAETNPEIAESETTIEEPAPNPFSEVRFPMASCGEALPDSDSEYPVNFYPVFIEHSDANLEKVKTEFCQDSFSKSRDNDELSIQISSFIDRDRAEDFADFLSETFGSAEVGQPTVIASNPNSTSARSSPSPSPTSEPRQVRSTPRSREGFSSITLNCGSPNRDTQVVDQLEIDCSKSRFGRGVIQLDNYGGDWYEVMTSEGEIFKAVVVDSAPKGDSYILVPPAGSIRENLHKDMGNQIELSVRTISRSQASRSIMVRCDDKPLKVWGIHLTPRCSGAGTNITYVNAARTNVKVDFGGDNPIAFQPVTIITQSGYFRSSSNQMRLTFTPL